MTPTPRLRFVERPDIWAGSHTGKTLRVLQQWWAYDPDSYTEWVTKTNGEWRDVPLEKENV
jgi:hypothetical protein